MNWLSKHPDRQRHARASAALGWLFALLALVSCCSLTSTQAASPQHPSASRPAAPRSVFAVSVSAPAKSAVVADAPHRHGPAGSCHGDSEQPAPVLLPGQPAPVALPSAAAVLPAAPLTGAVAIRGPSNDAVGVVDRLRLQVQRI